MNDAGRCSIHPYRPGICRLFPLGRYYEEDGFRHILQIHECEKTNRSKVKIRKWMDTIWSGMMPILRTGMRSETAADLPYRRRVG